MKTADGYLRECGLVYKNGKTSQDYQAALIGFAKLHVKAALQAANKNATRDFNDKETWVSEDSILNAYPNENIK